MRDSDFSSIDDYMSEPTAEDYNDSTTSTDSNSDSGTYPGTNISTGNDGGIGSMYQTGNMFDNKAIYTSMRGATATNPFPESFFSQLFGADNVNYTNILGSDRINEINDLRYNQAIGGMSNRTGSNTGKPYQMGDYYVGQPTQMGTVREVPQTGIGAFASNLPGIGSISKILGRNRGLPEELIEPYMEEQAKSANEPSFVSGILNTGKNVLNDISTGTKNLFTGVFPPPKPVASPSGGQFGVPDTRTFDEFGNVLEGFSKFQRTRPEPEGYNTVINPATGLEELRTNKPKVEQIADLSQTFKNINDSTKGVLGPDGMPVIDNDNLIFKLGINKEPQDPRATFTYHFNTV